MTQKIRSFHRRNLRITKKSSDITLTAANGSTVNTYGKKLLNINLNIRHSFPFVVMIVNISKLIIGDFSSKYDLLIDVRYKRLVVVMITTISNSLQTELILFNFFCPYSPYHNKMQHQRNLLNHTTFHTHPKFDHHKHIPPFAPMMTYTPKNQNE